MKFEKEANDTYSGARIQTRNRFYQTFGIFETRMKIVYPDCRHSAFWLQINKFPEPNGNAKDGAGLNKKI